MEDIEGQFLTEVSFTKQQITCREDLLPVVSFDWSDCFQMENLSYLQEESMAGISELVFVANIWHAVCFL